MSVQAPDQWFFDVWSLGYDFEIPQRFAYRPVHDAVLELLEHDSGRRVLDVGCGTGELVRRLRESFPRMRVVGCDFSAGMLRHAAAKGGAARWVRGDACRLPFGDGSFDIVTSTEAFHWFPDQDVALREFRRVLVPGGRLLLALAMPPLPLLSTLTHAASRLIGQPFYWPTRAEMRQRLARAGLQVETQRRVVRFPGLLFMPVLTSAVRPQESAPRRAWRSPNGTRRTAAGDVGHRGGAASGS
jgi:ubiquinone/menaquinone biosynthesis C-methylase UbiE